MWKHTPRWKPGWKTGPASAGRDEVYRKKWSKDEKSCKNIKSRKNNSSEDQWLDKIKKWHVWRPSIFFKIVSSVHMCSHKWRPSKDPPV